MSISFRGGLLPYGLPVLTRALKSRPFMAAAIAALLGPVANHSLVSPRAPILRKKKPIALGLSGDTVRLSQMRRLAYVPPTTSVDTENMVFSVWVVLTSTSRMWTR